jgi:putative oxidoreductase
MFESLPIDSGLNRFYCAWITKVPRRVAYTQGFLRSVGKPPMLAVLIGLLEVIGGILLLVGVVTRITAALFVIEMIGVTLIVKISKALREDMN